MSKDKTWSCGSCLCVLDHGRYKKCPHCDTTFLSGGNLISKKSGRVPAKPTKIKKAKVKLGDNKDRVGKLRPSLILPEFLLGIITVLTYGALKYSAYSWQKVDNPIESYTDALERHLIKIKMGEDIDEEWGLHHMFHLATNAMFLWWHLKNKAKFDDKNS